MGLHVITRPPLVEGPGHGSVLVCVHGAMDRATSFRRLWTQLPDWEVVAFDRRGYAGSLGLPLSDDFAQQVTDLLDVIHGRLDWQTRVVVLGHSFGGAVVLAAAAAHPGSIDAAVVYEPPALWRRDWPGHLPSPPTLAPADQAEAFMRRMAGDQVWDRLPEVTRQLRRSEGTALVNDLTTLRDGAPFDPTDISIPVVVGYGGRGFAHAAAWAKQLAADLPRGELVEVPEADHGIHFGQPAALAELVRSAAALAG
jgi:pimeloyl-ACP methyl ester carboxylesterase